jgi:hypothetical protein
MVADAWRALRLVLDHREMRVARVSDYALASLAASRLVERLRDRYPGRGFTWSFPTDHVLDSRCSTVLVWRMTSSLGAELLYGGPLKKMCRELDDGLFDAVMHEIAADEREGRS